MFCFSIAPWVVQDASYMIELVVSRELMKCPRTKLQSIVCNDLLGYSMPSEHTFTESNYFFSCHSIEDPQLSEPLWPTVAKNSFG